MKAGKFIYGGIAVIVFQVDGSLIIAVGFGEGIGRSNRKGRNRKAGPFTGITGFWRSLI